MGGAGAKRDDYCTAGLLCGGAVAKRNDYCRLRGKRGQKAPVPVCITLCLNELRLHPTMQIITKGRGGTPITTCNHTCLATCMAVRQKHSNAIRPATSYWARKKLIVPLVVNIRPQTNYLTESLLDAAPLRAQQVVHLYHWSWKIDPANLTLDLSSNNLGERRIELCR